MIDPSSVCAASALSVASGMVLMVNDVTKYDTREGARLLLNRERRPNCFAFSQQAFCIHRNEELN
jgi:hypothetical protein